MLDGDPIAPGVEALAEAQAYLRIDHDGETDLLGRLTSVAASLCEQFTGRTLLRRYFSETISAQSAWTRLALNPVAAITGLYTVAAGAPDQPLPTDRYAIDIDAHGDGWVRLVGTGAGGCVRVRYEAGMAADWAGVPQALRQGVMRLTAHLHAHRDAAADDGPPAAVTALWRPWRRMPFGGARHGGV